MRLKNESVNQAPSIGNLQDNLGMAVAQTVAAQAVKQGMTQTEAMAYGLEYAKTKLSDPRVVGAMGMIKQQFDSKMAEATGEYADGVKVPADIPALLSGKGTGRYSCPALCGRGLQPCGSLARECRLPLLL